MRSRSSAFQMAAISPLRRRMIEDMTIRNLSPATQRSYLRGSRRRSRPARCRPACSRGDDRANNHAGPAGWLLPRPRSLLIKFEGRSTVRCRPRLSFPYGDPRRAGRGAGGMTTWAVWFVAAMIVFACIEGFALVTRRIPTLSATIWQLTKRQPLLPFAIGL